MKTDTESSPLLLRVHVQCTASVKPVTFHVSLIDNMLARKTNVVTERAILPAQQLSQRLSALLLRFIRQALAHNRCTIHIRTQFTEREFCDKFFIR